MSTQDVKTRKAYRQGELLFVPLDTQEMETLNPKNASYPRWKKLQTNVLREGEATGHKHEVVAERAGVATLLAPAGQLIQGLANSTSGGAYAKEIFKYANGNIAYVATRWRKTLEIRRPTGKPWIMLKGQVALHWESLAGRLGADNEDLYLEHLMRGRDWEVTVYDPSGSEVITHGRVQNRQKQDKWLENGKETYYLSGVKVSQRLYEGDPNTWQPREVLSVPNAQLRCSLLNRMGYDRLLEKMKHRVIDRADDGGQLLEIDTAISEDSVSGLDKTMRLLKVVCPSTQQVYVLRVPPRIESYDQARQWTFGLREASIREGSSLELVKET